MSFLNKLFGNDEPKSSTPAENTFWNYIESEEDLKAAIEKSFQKKVVIFKHSTSCYISKMVLKSFEKEVGSSDKDVAYYFLDLIKYRSISNKIADEFGVTHQSPQMIVLVDGKAVENASHQSISENLI